MATKIHHRRAWTLAHDQEGVITRGQMLACEMTDEGIRHRVRCGRLRRLYPGVYAVGQLDLTQKGRWFAAVLACGDDAALSHDSAAAYWRLAPEPDGDVHVTVLGEGRSRKGIRVHRRKALQAI